MPSPVVVSSRRRARIVRSGVILVLGTIALLVFILMLGDRRRRHRAMEQAAWYASTLAERLGPGGALPLNLEPVDVPQRKSTAFRVEWLPRAEARHLRDSGGRCLVAQTVPLLQVLGRDGRAAVFFESGRFDVKWLTLSEFDEVYAKQRSEIRHLSDDAGHDPSARP